MFYAKNKKDTGYVKQGTLLTIGLFIYFLFIWIAHKENQHSLVTYTIHLFSCTFLKAMCVSSW